jgi:hypothetical protein
MQIMRAASSGSSTAAFKDNPRRVARTGYAADDTAGNIANTSSHRYSFQAAPHQRTKSRDSSSGNWSHSLCVCQVSFGLHGQSNERWQDHGLPKVWGHNGCTRRPSSGSRATGESGRSANRSNNGAARSPGASRPGPATPIKRYTTVRRATVRGLSAASEP